MPGSTQLMWLTDLSRLEFISDTIDITVHVLHGGHTLFFQTYRRGADDTVTIYNLDRIIDHNLGERTYGDYELIIGGVTRQLRIIRNKVRVPIDVYTWTQSQFMTPAREEHKTAVGWLELLNVYSESEEDIIVKATYVDDEFNVHTKTFGVAADQWPMINVSAELFLSPDKGTLVGYLVKCGERCMRYNLVNEEADPAFLYRNCFGYWEAIYMTGTKEQQPKYTRESAIIGGELVNYNIEEEDLIEVHTGLLDRAGEIKVRDLVRSTDVYLLNPDRTVGDKVVITDCTIRANNNPGDTSDHTITYRTSSQSPEILDGRKGVFTPGIFDFTFDHTFE